MEINEFSKFFLFNGKWKINVKPLVEKLIMKTEWFCWCTFCLHILYVGILCICIPIAIIIVIGIKFILPRDGLYKVNKINCKPKWKNPKVNGFSFR